MLTYLRERRGWALAVNPDGSERFNLIVPTGPLDPDAQALADRLVADNQPRATTKRRLAPRKSP